MKAPIADKKEKSVGFLASSKLQMRAVLVVRDLRESNLSPEVGSEERVCFCDLYSAIHQVSLVDRNR
jgi:hypothetical protein